jgi:hypothetical protein
MSPNDSALAGFGFLLLFFVVSFFVVRWLTNSLDWLYMGALREKERARMVAFRVTLRAVRRNARALVGRGLFG